MEYYATSDDDDYFYAVDDDNYNEDNENCYADDGGGDDDERVISLMEKGPAFKLITQESLWPAQKDVLQKVMDFLSLKEHHARNLLIHYRWDLEKVMNALDDKDNLFAEAGVLIIEHDTPLIPSVITCKVCFDHVSANESISMDCGHSFCNDCWTAHFIVKINEGKSRQIRCMEHKCRTICDDSKVRCLVAARDPMLAEKFNRVLLESFIEDNKLVKWCPSTPHCGNAIRIEELAVEEVECPCGFQFCFNCSNEAHSPCSCIMWDFWSNKCRDESETVNWITVNTKPCPKCSKLVEKNGGCNLVTCVCRQPFCWLCGAATGSAHSMESIYGHSCGRFIDREKKPGFAAARKNLARYIHYHSRYKAHTDSFKLECKLKQDILEKVKKLEEKEYVRDYNWVMNGLSRLFIARRVLCFTYPFAYYVFGDEGEMSNKEKQIKQNLFEVQQQQFEASIEKLSSFLEEKFDEYTDDKITYLRMNIITLCASIDTFCHNMYVCIENELLGSLKQVHTIAPYRSNGMAKASQLHT